jgi:hypothetical protein
VLALGLLLNTVGIGLFCWLVFTLAVYALPFSFGAPLVGIAAGAVTLAIGQTAFAVARSLIFRALIAAAFAIPAAVAGYHVVLIMSQIGVPSLAWREAFACLGAVFIGSTAWTRLTVFAEPRPLGTGGVVKNTPQPVLTAAAREG